MPYIMIVFLCRNKSFYERRNKVKLVLGRAGFGKSYYCMNEIKESLESEYDGSIIYIVPEQFSLTA